MKLERTFQLNITGVVQGVGFRPFIFNMALKKGLLGDVCNTASGVIIRVNAGTVNIIDDFISDIRKYKPEPAYIENIEIKQITPETFKDFKILKSKSLSEGFQLVSPDLATCFNCVKDINNQGMKRRFNYAFTNCTNCGPRFTIIKKLPYDRINTTMSDFAMCPECRNEYSDPSDRRFHAQPDACANCGPRLSVADYSGNVLEVNDPIDFAAIQLKKGRIIGIKSLGGFQIACDSANDTAVKRLRKNKKRPFKPFALMLKNITDVKKFYKINNFEKELLRSPKAPIVLLKKKRADNLNPISHYVSFDNNFEGVMLPYTPLHHLLFKKIKFPLIMTSGNVSEEPIAFKNEEAVKKLSAICDYFLLHDRDIYSRFDDSVTKIFRGKEMLLRRARGYAPYPVKLNSKLKDKIILAVGSEEKNAFCILKENYALISQHIGDIDNPESIDFFKSALNTFYELFNIKKIDLYVSDLHPGFKLNKLPTGSISPEKILKIQHHKAHIASVIAENNIVGSVIGFAWDGTGFGDDHKIWGSEVFIVDKNMNFDRIAHLREKTLAGGEASIKKPYRMALTYLYYSWLKRKTKNPAPTDFDHKESSEAQKLEDKNFIKYISSTFPDLVRFSSQKEILSIIFQIKTGFNSVKTTSMGRLFDAVSSVMGITRVASFEGEAAINLEMKIKKKFKDFYEYIITEEFNAATGESCFIIDDIDLFSKITNDILNGKNFEHISAGFHNTLANIILDLSRMARKRFSINDVALSGGVFQNNYLIDKTFEMLENNGFNVYTNYKVPVNDGGISLGQAYLGMRSIKDF
ncbi:MAG: carbamoyltransferase HypF [Candidatus Humimicrobiaceae bacterium]